MRPRHVGPLVLGLFLTLIVSGQSDWQSPPGKDFPIVGGTLANTRYSLLARINRSNIKQLGAAWMVHVEPTHVGLWMQATPVVVDG